MGLDYFQLEDYLKRADESKHDGFEHPTSIEEPIGKYEGGKRLVSVSARTNGTTILTPEKQMYRLHPHDFVSPNFNQDTNGKWVRERFLEQTSDGWMFNCIGDGLELRTNMLDNGESHRQGWWHTDYKQTREGQEGWRLPTAEEFAEIGYALLLLSKDPRYHNQVQLILDGNQQENIPGLRQHISRWPVLADHIEYKSNLKARITNPYGKDETVAVPEYPNGLVIATEQHEGLLGIMSKEHRKVLDEASWLKVLAGNKYTELAQIMQFIAPRLERQAKFVRQTREYDEPAAVEPYLREARIWTPSQQSRNNYSGRVASLGFDIIGIDLDFDDGVGGWPAFGVRSAKNFPQEIKGQHL
ncbi:hypothetical protein KY329_00230 [Candidatus Woesearchaeota archaeon]|nr:hypothetical protein [Candidatus Woesearchaeota archaeon]